jgi:hypothetical protein
MRGCKSCRPNPPSTARGRFGSAVGIGEPFALAIRRCCDTGSAEDSVRVNCLNGWARLIAAVRSLPDRHRPRTVCSGASSSERPSAGETFTCSRRAGHERMPAIDRMALRTTCRRNHSSRDQIKHSESAAVAGVGRTALHARRPEERARIGGRKTSPRPHSSRDRGCARTGNQLPWPTVSQDNFDEARPAA